MSSEKEQMAAFFKGTSVDQSASLEASPPDTADVAQRATEEFNTRFPVPERPTERDGFYNHLVTPSDADIQATHDEIEGSVFLCIGDDDNCVAVMANQEDAEYYCKCGRAKGFARRPLTRKVGRITTGRKMFQRDGRGVKEVPLDPETLLFHRGNIFFADSLVQAAAAVQVVRDNNKQWCDYYDALELRDQRRKAFIDAAVRKARGLPPIACDAMPLHKAQRGG